MGCSKKGNEDRERGARSPQEPDEHPREPRGSDDGERGYTGPSAGKDTGGQALGTGGRLWSRRGHRGAGAGQLLPAGLLECQSDGTHPLIEAGDGFPQLFQPADRIEVYGGHRSHRHNIGPEMIERLAVATLAR